MRPYLSLKSKLGPLGLVIALAMLVGCQRARLEPNWPKAQPHVQGQNSGTPAQPQNADGICKTSVVNPAKKVKILFLVDSSGSNFGEFGTVPSDPTKKWRANTLRKYITQYVGKENIFFGLALFKGTSAKAKITVDSQPGFSNNRAEVAEGFRGFLRTADGGNTPYKAALKMAKDMIAADLQKNSADQASYSVVTISDGHATDYKNPQDVIPDAASIVELAPSRITLNSVFYSARKVRSAVPPYLKSIADIGNGAFIMASSLKSLKLDDVVQLPAVSCQ